MFYVLCSIIKKTQTDSYKKCQRPSFDILQGYFQKKQILLMHNIDIHLLLLKISGGIGKKLFCT